MDTLLNWMVTAAQILSIEFLIYGLLLSSFGSVASLFEGVHEPEPEAGWRPTEYA